MIFRRRYLLAAASAMKQRRHGTGQRRQKTTIWAIRPGNTDAIASTMLFDAAIDEYRHDDGSNAAEQDSLISHWRQHSSGSPERAEASP